MNTDYPYRTYYAVVVYDLQQLYGGPEEGGWWYHDGDIVGVYNMYLNEDAAREGCRWMNEGFERNDYGEGLSATIVELPRRELKGDPRRWEYYGDAPQEDDYETRWDIPTSYLEHRPYYS